MNGNEKKRKIEFVLCKVCNINHDEGNRHKYFPNHKKSLSTLLTRFHSKLAGLRNPTALPRSRLWCVFCDADVGDSSSGGNAVRHLASEEHAKKVKWFLWKYGGREKDRVETYCFTESDVAKWEAKRKLVKSEAVSCGNEPGPGSGAGRVNDIRKECNSDLLRYDCSNSSGEFCQLNVANSVMPLQCYTNEYQISHFGISAAGNGGSSHPVEAGSSPSLVNSHGLAANGQNSLHYGSTVGNLDNRGGYQHGGVLIWGSNSRGSHCLNQVPSLTTDKAGGNVHTGAPPPWLDSHEENQLNVQLQSLSSRTVSVLDKPGKSSKLNPKRVGAAWAERRKIELEMEKRGETVKKDCDANWLPNFGRVWQSGSRKESRKEFEKEKHKQPEVEKDLEMSITVQPYVSKRMRKDVGGNDTGRSSCERADSGNKLFPGHNM